MHWQVAWLLSVFFLPSITSAAITKIVIEKPESFAGGHEFGVTGGQYIPCANTKEEREKKHGRRLSIEERYKDQATTCSR